MNAPLSKTQQEVTIGEGLAIGCLSLGIESIPSGPALDFGFAHAWREWLPAKKFPSIRNRGADTPIRGIMHKSERRRGPLAAWKLENVATPYIVIEGWNVEDVADSLNESTGLHLSDWRELARLFSERAV